MVGRGLGRSTRPTFVQPGGRGVRESTQQLLRGNARRSTGRGLCDDAQSSGNGLRPCTQQVGAAGGVTGLTTFKTPFQTPIRDDIINEEEIAGGADLDDIASNTQFTVHEEGDNDSSLPFNSSNLVQNQKHMSQLHKRAGMVLNVHEAADPTIDATEDDDQGIKVRTKYMHGSQLERQREDGNVAENGSSQASATSGKRKRGDRGKYRSLVVEKKTMNGKSKLEVEIPDYVLQAVGANARVLVNFCGYVVRTIPVMDCSDWSVVVTNYGDSMWMQVKNKFKIKAERETPRLQGFVLYIMQRLYRYWKSHLHKYYKECGSSQDPPVDFPPDQWKLCCEVFESDAFKKRSTTNKTNRQSDTWCKHTTGNLSFPEMEVILTEKNDNIKPSADVIWLAEHTRTNDKGVLEWVNDKRSKDVHAKLHKLVVNKDQEGAPQTQEEMLISVLGHKAGYTRGRGSGYGGASIKARIQAEQQQKIQEQEEMINNLTKKLEANKSEMEQKDARQAKEMEEFKLRQQRDMSKMEHRLTQLISVRIP